MLKHFAVDSDGSSRGSKAREADGVFDKRHLKDRLVVGLLSLGTRYMEERWAEESARGQLSQLRADLTRDTVDTLENPVVAASLELLRTLLSRPDALRELVALTYALGRDLPGAPDRDGARDVLSATADLVQLHGTKGKGRAFLRVLAEGLSPDVGRVVATGRGALEPRGAALWNNLALARDTAREDTGQVLARMFHNLASTPGEFSRSPLATLVDAVTAVNRVEPGQRGVLSAEDWAQVARELSAVMLDDRRGLERMYELVQCRDARRAGACE